MRIAKPHLSAFFVAVLIFCAHPSLAANVILGNCNQITQNVELAQGSTLIVENDCIADDPAKSFRVRYFWLDSLSASLLLAGHIDDNLRAIAGPSPQMWRGGNYPILAEIIQQFGERPGPNSKFIDMIYNSHVLPRDNNDEGHYQSFQNIPESVRRRMRIYNANEPIPWPDVEAHNEFFNSIRWPSKYQMTYGINSDDDPFFLDSLLQKEESAASSIPLCTLLHGFVQREEFRSYRQNVNLLTDLVRKNKLAAPIEPISVEAADFGKGATLTSYRAMRFFGSYNWPDDFLIKYGRYGVDDCAGVAGLGLVSIPRELFVLVAVVEATGRRLELEGFGYQVDRSKHLRAHLDIVHDETETFAFPAMNRGDTVVVPLRLELRYDLSKPPFRYIRPNDTSQRYHAAIQSYRSTIVLDENASQQGGVSKPTGSFQPPDFNEITQTYYFGEARDLKSVVIGGNVYGVRNTPRLAMISVAGFEGGSCPFLEIVEEDNKRSLHGRILVGASSQSKARIESVPIPLGAKSIAISEREPEISYLSEIVLETKSGKERVILAKNVVLRPWQSLTLRIPENLRNQPISLSVAGYYELLPPIGLARK